MATGKTYEQRVQAIAELIRALGKPESDVDSFVSKSLAHEDRRRLAYFARRYLGYWKDVFGDELRDDIVEYTQPLFDSLAAQMKQAQDDKMGWHALVVPRDMRFGAYHFVPFQARGYLRTMFHRCGKKITLLASSPEILGEPLKIASAISSDSRSESLLRHLLSIADEEGYFELEPKYYDALGWSSNHAKRYAHYAIWRMRKNGWVATVQEGSARVVSLNRFSCPSLMRFSLALNEAISSVC